MSRECSLRRECTRSPCRNKCFALVMLESTVYEFIHCLFVCLFVFVIIKSESEIEIKHDIEMINFRFHFNNTFISLRVTIILFIIFFRKEIC